jgi:hypothetical protein
MSSNFDASIPVLTEVFHDKPMTAPRHGDLAAELESRAVEGWGDEEWELLERRLSERILHQMQSRVDFVLEQRLRDSMAEVLQHALRGLTSEIQAGLQDTIEKIVARAVTQEIAHLQAQKKRAN